MHRKRLTIDPKPGRSRASGASDIPKFNLGTRGTTEVRMGRLCSDPHRTLAQLRFTLADDLEGDECG
jgi:hypothetical protein